MPFGFGKRSGIDSAGASKDRPETLTLEEGQFMARAVSNNPQARI
jgi:hypothetical protein